MNFNRNSNQDFLNLPDESEHMLLDNTMTDQTNNSSTIKQSSARLSSTEAFNSTRRQNQKDEDPWHLLQGSTNHLYKSYFGTSGSTVTEEESDTKKRSANDFPSQFHDVDGDTGEAPSNSSNNDSSFLQPYDIICGRNSIAFNNIGNRRFRVTISLNLQRYNSAKTRQERTVVIKSIIDVLQNEAGARFLKRKGNVFVELSERQVRQKVAHALRDMNCYSGAGTTSAGGVAAGGVVTSSLSGVAAFATAAGPSGQQQGFPGVASAAFYPPAMLQQQNQQQTSLPQLRQWSSGSEILSSSFSSPPTVATLASLPTELYRSDSSSSF